jgi:hypothetical protein
MHLITLFFRFWKLTMSTNLHTLQQQMTEGLARSMTRCQQLESVLKATQERNGLLEAELLELRPITLSHE